MAPGSLKRPTTSISEMGPTVGRTSFLVARSPHTQLNSGGSSSKVVRGTTKGKHTARLIAHNDGQKLPVTVLEETCALVGYNATRVANELGVQIRLAAPLQGVNRWDNIEDSIKASIIQATRDKFEIKNYDESVIVQQTVDKKCANLYNNWKCKMKAHYLKLLEAGVDPYSKPYQEVSKENWTYMIDHVWKDETHKKRSAQNKMNRSKLSYNHTMGSRSFPAGLSIEAIERGGEMPHLVDFYETAHWSKRKGDWIEPICREKHDEMKRRQEESSQPGATPLTQEQIAIAVLGKRSRYLKGLGVGLKSPSSSRSTVASQARDQEEVQSLKAEIESLRGLTQSQQARIEEQDMRVEEQDKRLEDQNKSFENQNKKLKELENIMWQQMEMTKALTSHGGSFSR